LGVNAIAVSDLTLAQACQLFQWAPTLEGECYIGEPPNTANPPKPSFNGHPPLGVNATRRGCRGARLAESTGVSMGTHPWG